MTVELGLSEKNNVFGQMAKNKPLFSGLGGPPHSAPTPFSITHMGPSTKCMDSTRMCGRKGVGVSRNHASRPLNN